MKMQLVFDASKKMLMDPTNKLYLRPELKAGLISVWEFDETTGTVSTDAHGPNDGVIGSGVSFVAGKIAGAYDISETTIDNMIVDTPTMSFTNAMTINVWIKPRYANQQQHVIKLITEDQADGDHASLIVYCTSPSDPCDFAFATIGSALEQGLVNSSTYPLNAWVMVTCVLDPGQTYPLIYVNGVEDTNQTGRIAFSGSGTYTVYQITMGNVYQHVVADCVMDQPAIWGVALSQAQITALYNSGNGLPYTAWS